MVTVSLVFMLQDLFERSEPKTKRVESLRDRDRVELHLSPALDFPREGRTRHPIGFQSDFNPNFSCNNFDFGASFRTLLDKNMREDFLQGLLGALESEIATNGLYLACQASPTLCDLIKHYKTMSNMILQMEYQQCQTLEQVLTGAERRIAAESLSKCLAEQERKGKTLHEAMAYCRHLDMISNLSGERVRDMNLLQELGNLLQLSGGSRDLLGKLAQPLEIKGKSAHVNLQLAGVEPIFMEKRGGYENAWQQAVDESRSGAVKPDTLKKLSPEGTSPIKQSEVMWVSLLPEERRNAVIASVSTASAMVQLSSQLHEIERALESADHLPSADAWKPELEQRRKWIRGEMQRLQESFHHQTTLNKSLREANALAEADSARLVSKQWEPMRMKQLEHAARETTRPWGEAKSELKGAHPLNSPSTPKEGAACDGCGEKEFQFGQTSKTKKK